MTTAGGRNLTTFVFDLDGTICFNGQPVSEVILRCLEDLTATGHKVIFASARPIRDLLPVLHQRFHEYPLIGGNGSLISINGKIAHVESFSEDQMQGLFRLIEEHQATFLIDSDWDYAYTGPVDHPILHKIDHSKLARQVPVHSLKSVIKILILTAEDMESLAEKFRALGVTVHRHRKEHIIDVNPPQVDKWTALKKLGVDEQQFVAFGNDSNDIPMFKTALHSVMIGHHDELKPFASESIPLEDNVEDQIVAKILELANQQLAV
ncbi:HAD-IIB family hydrolase [Insulibacter thermoxylanivorax]|uniref:HAD-IIB family hydrolase n=1 Tax=Insulibacter thermoxylanivorax TaxID=2749268 RepID=UPI001910E0A3